MRRSLAPLSCALLAVSGCRSAPANPFAGVDPLQSAAAIVDGSAPESVPRDTVDAELSIRLLRA
jgi:hypothetical protein